MVMKPLEAAPVSRLANHEAFKWVQIASAICGLIGISAVSLWYHHSASPVTQIPAAIDQGVPDHSAVLAHIDDLLLQSGEILNLAIKASSDRARGITDSNSELSLRQRTDEFVAQTRQIIRTYGAQFDLEELKRLKHLEERVEALKTLTDANDSGTGSPLKAGVSPDNRAGTDPSGSIPQPPVSQNNPQIVAAPRQLTPSGSQSAVTAAGSHSPCDINGDGVVDDADVAMEIDGALGYPTRWVDLDGDGAINVIDVQLLTNVLLGLIPCPLKPASPVSALAVVR